MYRIDSYKVGIIFDTYHRMIAEWTSGSGPHQLKVLVSVPNPFTIHCIYFDPKFDGSMYIGVPDGNFIPEVSMNDARIKQCNLFHHSASILIFMKEQVRYNSTTKINN